VEEANMLHLEDIAEEIATGRYGKIDSIGSERVQGHETPNLWRVYFADGKEPSLKYFKSDADLRLTSCPHAEPEPGFYPARPLIDPL
jgi:hypothetical protein